MYLVFDTETTGLPPYAMGRKGYISPKHFVEWNNCRVVQLAWMVVNDTHEIVATRDFLIRPRDFTIPEESTRIHGITQEKACSEGVSIKEALRAFLEDLPKVDVLVAHNIDFDIHVVLAELYRAKMDTQSLLRLPTYCTMKEGSTRYEKWCKLGELYEKYFHQKPDIVQHRACNDVMLCYTVYKHQRSII